MAETPRPPLGLKEKWVFSREETLIGVCGFAVPGAQPEDIRTGVHVWGGQHPSSGVICGDAVLGKQPKGSMWLVI